MAEERRGLLLGAAAFGMWGLFPLYWPLLEPADATEILAHRVLWSLIVMAALLIATRRVAALRAMWGSRRVRYVMVGAGIVIGFNWFTYIWGVNNGHVVETSLGYYINPLLTVLLGVVVLGERLRTWQWVALGVAFVAVVVLSLELGRPPWISLILAFSFGTYGLLKKQAAVGPTEGLTYEGLVLVPVALGYIVWLSYVGQASAWSQGSGHVALLTSTGIVTAVPLLCFAGAANRIPLSTIGLLQYIAPTLQFLIGVLVFHEAMPTIRWLGFSLVWLALVILTAESLVALRRRTAAVEHPLPGVEALEAGVVMDPDCLEHRQKAAQTTQTSQTAKTARALS
ncbi:MAG: EamA family transporter RarD [Gammaproteobacteria bacterium]